MEQAADESDNTVIARHCDAPTINPPANNPTNYPTMGLTENGLYDTDLKYDDPGTSSLGTKDYNVICSVLNQLIRINKQGHSFPDRKNRDLIDINSAIAMLYELKPTDTAEIMVVSQMIAFHCHSMQLMESAVDNLNTIATTKARINAAAKCSRMFMDLFGTLNKYRNKGQQNITVQHVNISDGGQAVIGDVKSRGG